ncbi:TPA: hypothetical protein ACL4WB_000343 [Streptococcus pneumoniae]
MKSSGIVGLVGGILLLICPFVLLGTAVNTAATTLNGGSLFLATLKKFKSEE